MSDKLRYFSRDIWVRGAKISEKLKLRLTCAGVEPLLVQPAEKEKRMKIVLWKKLQGKKLELWKTLPEEERGRQSLLS